MVLDLERVTFGETAEDKAFAMKLNIEDLAIRYRAIQATFRLRGLLEAA